MSATYMPFNIYFTTSATFDIELGLPKKLRVSMGILQPFQPGSQHLIIRVHIEMSNPHNHTNLDNGFSESNVPTRTLRRREARFQGERKIQHLLPT